MIIGSGHKIHEIRRNSSNSPYVYGPEYFLLDIDESIDPDIQGDFNNPTTTAEIPSGSFDVIFIEGIPNGAFESEGMRALKRIIKPGGRLMFNTHSDTLRKPYDDVLALTIPNIDNKFDDEYKKRLKNPKEYAKELESGVYIIPNHKNLIGIAPERWSEKNKISRKYVSQATQEFLQNAGYDTSGDHFQFSLNVPHPIYPAKVRYDQFVTVTLPKMVSNANSTHIVPCTETDRFGKFHREASKITEAMHK